MRRARCFARRVRDFGRGQGGAAAAEFALVIPLFVLMTIGIYNLSFMMYAASTLHYSVERAARCLSVSPTLCPAANIQTYGSSLYNGPKITPTYVLTNPAPACGNQVTATGSYVFRTGLVRLTVPMSASACFPAVPS